MSKKLTELAGEGGENQLAAGIRDSANQIWLAGLGAFAKTQKEGTKFFNSLVEEGETFQTHANKSARDTLEDVKAKAAKSWDQLSWNQLEQVFEARVTKVLHALSVPTRKDLDSLSHRVAELTTVTKKLAEELESPKHSRSKSS